MLPADTVIADGAPTPVRASGPPPPASPPRSPAAAAAAERDPIYSDADDGSDGGNSISGRDVTAPATSAAARPAAPETAAAAAAAAGGQWEAARGARAVGPKVRVRVTREGRTTEEELDPMELAALYAQQQAALRSVQQKFDFLAVPEWVRLHPMVGPYLAEALGTFAWTLVLSLTSVRNASIFDMADDTNMTPIPIGFMMTCMVFTFGYISGGHFNPAISVAVFLIRKLTLVQCACYVLCQVGAALAAGLVAMVLQGANENIFVPAVAEGYLRSGIFSELIYTFAIAVVVLNAAYSRQTGSFFYGFAVGMTVAAGSAAVSRYSGGAFNPAAATGLQIAVCIGGSCEDLKSFWVYWMAPLIGAGLAALAYSQMFQPETTQVLQDHKAFTDPAKLAERRQRASATRRSRDASRTPGGSGADEGEEDDAAVIDNNDFMAGGGGGRETSGGDSSTKRRRAPPSPSRQPSGRELPSDGEHTSRPRTPPSSPVAGAAPH